MNTRQLLQSTLLGIATLTMIVPALASASANTSASTPWEATAAYGTGNVIHTDESRGISEFRGGLGYFPTAWTYHSLSFGAEGSGAYLHTTAAHTGKAMWAIAVTPVVRWSFYNTPTFSVYLEAGSGPGLLSKTVFNGRNLGIHYTFEDFGGVGVITHTQIPMVAGVRIMHYSNASIGTHNSGTTVPVVFYLGFRF